MFCLPKIGQSLALFLMALVASVASPETRAEPLVAGNIPISDDYVLRTWDVDDGLPGNNVSSIAQTPDGYLWLVTSSGLSRFDGVRFTPFLKESTPGLESNQMGVLFVDRDGALWVGLERGGVARKIGDHFEVIMPFAPRTAYPTWTSSFAQDSEGAVWFGLDPGKAFRWQKGVRTGFSIGQGAGTAVQADGSGRIWFTTLSACGYFDGNRFQAIDPNGGKWPTLAPSRDGGMWVKRGFALRHYRGVGVGEMIAETGDLTISSLLEDHAGNLWIGTLNAGLFRYRNGGFVRVPTSQTAVTSIMEDRQGNLWVGMVGGGLDRLRPRRFSLRQKKHGLPTDSVTSLCEDGEGRLWLAGRNGTVARANDSSNQTFLSLEKPRAAIMAMCPDPQGGVWMATLKGLVRWQGGAFTNEPSLDPLTALLLDRQGDLWVATIKKGLMRLHNDAEEPVSPENGLSEPRALAEDPAGRLWVGTEAGRLFQRIQRREDQAGGGGFVAVPLPGAEDQQIRFIVPEKNGEVWVGVNNEGLYRWRDGQIARLPLNTGLPVNDLRVLAIEPGGEPGITGTNSQTGLNADGAGRQFWFGTGGGMFRVAGSEIDAVMDGRQQQMQVVAYRRDDGMPNVDYVFGFKNTATLTHDGHLWFATTRGALEIGPEETRDLLPPVPLLIEEVGGVRVSNSEKLTLPPRPGPLQIRYTLADLSAPEQVHFRYRLLGWEGDWVQADRQRTATFTHLAPGKYRFEVAAAVGNGPWLSATASLPFTVRAAWWETDWFRFGMALFSVVALTGVVRFIVRRRMMARMRRLEQGHALERERTRIARDMHDDIGARLMRIALMSEVAASEPDLRTGLGNQLGGIAHEAREVVDTLDEIVWTVNPRNDTLARLIGYLAEASEAFLDSTSITLTLELPKEIPDIAVPSDVRHHILLVVKEALNNVVKHARATSVSLKIALEKEMLSILIEDDGSGFAPAAVAPFSNGLQNSEQRLASIGGSYRIESRPGQGAIVKLEIPLAFGVR
ncbi:MAG: ATP-binding protein [Fibrobacteres bacterium]|nr:ATP-binding protein [Fibrobacterota bacterium]